MGYYPGEFDYMLGKFQVAIFLMHMIRAKSLSIVPFKHWVLLQLINLFDADFLQPFGCLLEFKIDFWISTAKQPQKSTIKQPGI